MNHNENAPTDGEREALSEFLFTVYDHGTNPNALREADAILAFLARFRRSEVPEPSAARECGFMGCGSPRCVEICTPEPQGEPSDAQVTAALHALYAVQHPYSAPGGLSDYGDEVVSAMRAALRAAWGVR